MWNHCVEEGWFVVLAAQGEQREGSELKRFVLPNEVNTPSGRMRPPCRAETVVTSVILYKTGRGGRETRGSIVGSGMRSKVEKENEEKKKKRREVSGDGEAGKKPQATKSSYASFLLQNRLFVSTHLYFIDLSFSPTRLLSLFFLLLSLHGLPSLAIKMIK